jgi:hypothetical protein
VFSGFLYTGKSLLLDVEAASDRPGVSAVFKNSYDEEVSLLDFVVLPPLLDLTSVGCPELVSRGLNRNCPGLYVLPSPTDVCLCWCVCLCVFVCVCVFVCSSFCVCVRTWCFGLSGLAGSVHLFSGRSVVVVRN